jgi:hypothetical protein
MGLRDSPDSPFILAAARILCASGRMIAPQGFMENAV